MYILLHLYLIVNFAILCTAVFARVKREYPGGVTIQKYAQAGALTALAFLITPERCVVVDLAQLQNELAECGWLSSEELQQDINYWLETRCKLGNEFVAQIVEVSVPQDNIDWRIPEWLVRTLYHKYGTAVRIT